jgi:hypothetical protein
MDNSETIQKCKCGSEHFVITEYVVWKAAIDKETGRLDACAVKGNGIDSVECRMCGREYGAEDFAEVEFL